MDRAALLPDSDAKAIECFSLNWSIYMTKTFASQRRVCFSDYVSTRDYFE
jgi:hypothetical protein